MAYRRVLVPTDGSAVAEAAVAHALEIADPFDAEIHALFVFDVQALEIGLGTEQIDRIRQGRFGEMDELEARANEATGYVADLAAERGLETVEHVSAGRPHSLIVDYADDHDVDLIVMGSHGRSGIRRTLLGSVTERVLRSTDRPVLVVEPRDAGDEGDAE